MDKERIEAQNNGKELPLLHGIPISIKDLIDQKGFLSTVGCAFLCADEFIAKADSVIV
jgi:Asp-tRNA(Asn)/Glu-tRNA(Gln) amidotransferase A subunit family amidase